jgi:hypothetical protein
MSELNIDNVEEVETIPTDNTTEELQENVEQSTTGEVSGEVSGEVIEPEDNSAEIEAEQERLRREHEEYLNSFPGTTVFYRDLLVNGNVKSLGNPTKNPHVAEQWGYLDNHFDESELTYVGTPECGIWYLKGYEKPEPSEIEKMKAYAKSIETQVDAHLQELASSRGYDDVKSCVGYFNSSDETFQREAKAMTVYRDHLYRTCYNIMDQCKKGQIDYKTVTLEYILSLINPIDW